MKYTFSENFANMKPSAIREIFKSLTDPSIISLAAGNPSPLSFPSDELAELAADIFKNDASTALQYSITEGYPPFKAALADRIKRKFDIGKDSDSIMVTSGGQQGIDLACRVLCDPGDTVIAEDPSFIGALNAFRAVGVKLVGVKLDDDGMNIDALKLALEQNPRTKLIYVIPTFQNPTGLTTSLEKRREIYRLAKEHGVMILEDNPYGELRFRGENVPTIKSMDDDGIVIYSSSFSKILSAGMRVGFVSAPDKIIQKMAVGKQCEDVHTNIFFQMLCYKYMTERDIDGHIAKICSLYRDKCDLMLSCLDKNMPNGVKYTRPEGGLFISLTLPEHIDMPAFVREAIEHKVAVVPGSAFNCDENAPSNFVRLNYSTPSDDDIVKAIKILADLLKSKL